MGASPLRWEGERVFFAQEGHVSGWTRKRPSRARGRGMLAGLVPSHMLLFRHKTFGFGPRLDRPCIHRPWHYLESVQPFRTDRLAIAQGHRQVGWRTSASRPAQWCPHHAALFPWRLTNLPIFFFLFLSPHPVGHPAPFCPGLVGVGDRETYLVKVFL